ncbi:hypothetical protein NA57DRAFT_59280 [Rhizodiscina lignyota]|uniref:Uncharacterized protein n=1 Tax=Rhizodiscina lignyota TaxID=1504668 RepID=A0A9P4I918_9PEZI|nr:hypothetical protein NA57DRAFT_59280 [Rhizodiscina lignyota]
MEEATSSNLLWINSSPSNVPFGSSRHRGEVMRKVAQRRRKDPSRPHPNSRQLPIFIQDDNANEPMERQKDGKDATEAGFFDKVGHVQPVRLDNDVVEFGSSRLHTETLTHPREFGLAYPPMLTKCNVELLDLSFLASLEVGRYTGQKLLENRENLSHFLRAKNWSYLPFVAGYLNQSALVRSATDCVVAQVRSLLTPNEPKWGSIALSSYSKALSKLQAEIDRNTQSPTTEILCATQVLGLYEMLNPSRENAWINHAAGAACIIRLRGPESYSSEFEKSLFMSHVGPIITESVLNNQACFLDQPAWKAVLRSVITDSPLIPERNALVISLLSILTSIPGIFRDFTEALCHDPDSPRAVMKKLMSRAQNLQLALQNWHSRNMRPDGNPVNAPIFCEGFSKIQVLFSICSMYSNRLNTCIFWAGTPGIEELEEESQRLANYIVSLYKEEACSSLQNSVILAHKLYIAEAIIESADDWGKQLKLGSAGSQLFKMPKESFKNWCCLFGRKTS